MFSITTSPSMKGQHEGTVLSDSMKGRFFRVLSNGIYT